MKRIALLTLLIGVTGTVAADIRVQYAWGRDMAQTLRYLEAFDFLCDCELRERGMRQP